MGWESDLGLEFWSTCYASASLGKLLFLILRLLTCKMVINTIEILMVFWWHHGYRTQDCL